MRVGTGTSPRRQSRTQGQVRDRDGGDLARSEGRVVSRRRSCVGERLRRYDGAHLARGEGRVVTPEAILRGEEPRRHDGADLAWEKGRVVTRRQSCAEERPCRHNGGRLARGKSFVAATERSARGERCASRRRRPSRAAHCPGTVKGASFRPEIDYVAPSYPCKRLRFCLRFHYFPRRAPNACLACAPR